MGAAGIVSIIATYIYSMLFRKSYEAPNEQNLKKDIPGTKLKHVEFEIRKLSRLKQLALKIDYICDSNPQLETFFRRE